MVYFHMYLKIQASEYGQVTQDSGVSNKLIKHYYYCYIGKNVYTVCNANAPDSYATG